MSLHGLLSVTIGVPNVEETAAYYADFGLTPETGGWFGTTDGGQQLRIVYALTRRPIEMPIGADNVDDLERAAANLTPLGRSHEINAAGLVAIEPVTGTRVGLAVAPRVRQSPASATIYNRPGRFD